MRWIHHTPVGFPLSSPLWWAPASDHMVLIESVLSGNSSGENPAGFWCLKTLQRPPVSMWRSRNLQPSTGRWLVPGTDFCFRWNSAQHWPTCLPFTACSLPTETCWSWGASCGCVLMKPLLASLAGKPVHGRILSQVCVIQVLACGQHGQWGRLVELCSSQLQF